MSLTNRGPLWLRFTVSTRTRKPSGGRACQHPQKQHRRSGFKQRLVLYRVQFPKAKFRFAFLPDHEGENKQGSGGWNWWCRANQWQSWYRVLFYAALPGTTTQPLDSVSAKGTSGNKFLWSYCFPTAISWSNIYGFCISPNKLSPQFGFPYQFMLVNKVSE